MPMFANLATLIDLALTEDIGSGDVTTEAVVQDQARQAKGVGKIIAQADIVVAGLPIVTEVFARMEAGSKTKLLVQEGAKISADTVVAEINASLGTLLKGERTALNFLQRLSGIATMTRRFVDCVKGTGVQVMDTRKTLPGYRDLEKYAVKMGGGHNHRQGLYDAFLIKDNHIAVAGSITKAVAQVRSRNPKKLPIEVEASSLAEVEEALAAKVDIILLDNMSVAMMKQAVALIGHQAKTEASGGVTEKNILAIAQTGVNRISIGALTHSATAADFSMKILSND